MADSDCGRSSRSGKSGRSFDDRTIVTQSEAVVAAGQFGDKTIGMLSGFMLLVNNVTGPGLVQMPQVFNKSGWFMTIASLLICWWAAGFSCTMMLEAMKRIPGNSKFEQRIEFTTLAKYHFVGKLKFMYYATLICFLMSFLTTLVTSVIESAQTMDEALIELFGKSCAIQIYNNESASIGGTMGLDCIHESSEGSGESPFGPNAYVISIGFVIVLTVALPLGYWNLDDNIWVQNFAFCGLCFIVSEWCIQALVHGIDFEANNVPAVGSDQSQIGTVLFNYAFVTTIPSWVNEKKVGVPINKSIWASSLLGTTMFLFTGLLCAGAWDASSGNLLSTLTKSSTPGVGKLTRALAYLFPIVALVTSIPIFSIIVRYNLLENNLCGPFWAAFWGAVFPWLAAIALYTGDALDDVVNWSGLLTIVPLNFVLPAWFYIESLTCPAQGGEYLDDDEAAEAGLETALLSHHQHPWQVSGTGSIIEATGNWNCGDLVRVWIPGHQWVPATILNDQNEDGTYPVSCEGLQENERNIAASNIRTPADMQFGQQQTDIQEEDDRSIIENKPIEHLSPKKLV